MYWRSLGIWTLCLTSSYSTYERSYGTYLCLLKISSILDAALSSDSWLSHWLSHNWLDDRLRGNHLLVHWLRGNGLSQIRLRRCNLTNGRYIVLLGSRVELGSIWLVSLGLRPQGTSLMIKIYLIFEKDFSPHKLFIYSHPSYYLFNSSYNLDFFLPYLTNFNRKHW